MKINFEMSGGFAHFPVLSEPFIIDTIQLELQVANQLESLIIKSRFFDQPPQVDTLAKGAADFRTYTITVEDDTRIHTVQLTDPITDANLERLVSQLQIITRLSPP